MFNLKKVKRLESQIDTFQKVLNSDLERFEKKEKTIKEQKEEIRILKHNELILLENAEELRRRNAELENNIEFLFNNLSAQKKKLIRPEAN